MDRWTGVEGWMEERMVEGGGRLDKGTVVERSQEDSMRILHPSCSLPAPQTGLGFGQASEALTSDTDSKGKPEIH